MYQTFIDPGYSIMEWKALHPALFYDQTWYESSEFAHVKEATAERRYRLLPEAEFLPYKKQCALLKPHEFIPLTRQLVSAVILEYLATKKWLPFDYFARCQDILADGRRAGIGIPTNMGFYIGRTFDASAYPAISTVAFRE